jgi:hypothetical protein
VSYGFQKYDVVLKNDVSLIFCGYYFLYIRPVRHRGTYNPRNIGVDFNRPCHYFRFGRECFYFAFIIFNYQIFTIDQQIWISLQKYEV